MRREVYSLPPRHAAAQLPDPATTPPIPFHRYTAIMPAAPTILHVDMDAFFASVEQLDRPELRDKPVLVGHDGLRGVVAAASYESRVYGCHSAQPMAVAKRLCPHAAVVPVRMGRYQEISRAVFAIFDAFSPLVEPLSVDEAFIDLAGTERLHGAAEAAAGQLKQRIRSELGLTASVGVAPNKFLAKLASDMNKPDGLTIIRAEDVESILPPLPVSRLWGIGKVTAGKLASIGIKTIADLRRASPELLVGYLGSDADRYARLSLGIDDRSVVPDRQAKSIGHEQTFGIDVTDSDHVRAVLLGQTEQVAHRLRKSGVEAQGVSIKIRFGNFQTVTRSAKLPHPTAATADLWQSAQSLFKAWPFHPVRLIGMSAERLSSASAEPTLFPHPAHERQKKLDAVADQINEKFGRRAVARGARK